jgi:imidazole glycerol-phosphate synthase subunit HisH
MSIDVAIVRTGCANLASVQAAFERLGAKSRLVDDADSVARAARVVLPGVGAFGPASDRLLRSGIAEALRQRVVESQPLLAICLGMQLLCTASDESPGTRGLGVIDATIRRFPSTARVPQMGWNRIESSSVCRMLRSGFAYFANSYRLDEAPPGWAVSKSIYAGPFIAAIERGQVLACQFHPELSGTLGLDLLTRWLDASSEGPTTC